MQGTTNPCYLCSVATPQIWVANFLSAVCHLACEIQLRLGINARLCCIAFLRLKMGVCEGFPRSLLPDFAGKADYLGDNVNQAARFMDAGNGRNKGMLGWGSRPAEY